MRAKRRNIQFELALEPEARGEARSAGDQGTEARTAHACCSARYFDADQHANILI